MNKFFKQCLDWRVLVGVVIGIVVVFVFAPSYARSLWPLAIVLVCPISMGLMMLMMTKGNKK